MPAIESIFDGAKESGSTPVYAVLVAVDTGAYSPAQIASGLDELEGLLKTAGGTAFARVVQSRPSPDVATYIGSGKVSEISDLCRDHEIGLVVFDDELTPSQIRNLEDAMETEVRVIDRSMLILDIFALHAVSGEGKLQVELAQLKYTAPRLTGKGAAMSRLGGGIGTRGPGESKLESDRRHIHRRIAALEAEIENLARTRATMRASRDRSGITRIAIVGYTNVGKSTLLNRLTDAGILSEDKLFATLDPTTRQFRLPSGENVLLTDTVGFIRKLPHQLVSAFRSTLDEAVNADVLLIVSDVSDPECAEHLAVSEKTLEELGAGDKPTLYLFNKCDKADRAIFPNLRIPPEKSVYLSVKEGQGIEDFLAKLEILLHGGKVRRTYLIPHAEQKMLNFLYKNATVESAEYEAEGVRVSAIADERVRGTMRAYDTDPATALPAREEQDPE